MDEMKIRISVYKLKRYLRDNLGFPFILAFQIMFVTCVFLVQVNSALANEVAIYAYYLLVLGVVLQIVSFLRERRSEKSA